MYDGEKNETKELSERLIKNENMLILIIKTRNTHGLNGHETRGVWTRAMIAASDSSKSLPRVEASRGNDVVSYGVQQVSLFIGSFQSRFI